MSDFAIFIVGIAITLVVGMGVITSQVFVGHQRKPKSYVIPEPIQNI